MNEITNESALEPILEAAETADQPRAHRNRASRHHGERSSHGWLNRKSQRLMLAVALGIALLLLLLVSVISEMRIAGLAQDVQIVQTELFQAKQALAKATPELQQARMELSNLIKGHFPHLQELVTDKVIKLDAGYAKNVVFTVLHKNEKLLYEYRLVLENTSESSVRPDARVFVFDHRGAQIGMGEIAERTDMIPGESRSFSSIIERFIDEEPRYFYVWTRGKGKS